MNPGSVLVVNLVKYVVAWTFSSKLDQFSETLRCLLKPAVPLSTHLPRKGK